MARSDKEALAIYAERTKTGKYVYKGEQDVKAAKARAERESR